MGAKKRTTAGGTSSKGSVLESYELGPGAVLDSMSYFTDTLHHYTVRALSKSVLLYFHKNQSFASFPPSIQSSLVTMSTKVVEVMRPTLNQFLLLGLKREFKRAGDTLYTRESKAEATYVVVSGRVRIVSGDGIGERRTGGGGGKREQQQHQREQQEGVNGVKKDVEDAKAVASTDGSVPENTSSTTSSSSTPDGEPLVDDDLNELYSESFRYSDFGPVRYGDYNPVRSNRLNTRFEVARGECVGEVAFLNGEEEESGSSFRHSSTAICIRDTELVKISRASYTVMQSKYPAVVIKFSQVVAQRLQQLLRSTSSASSSSSSSSSSLSSPSSSSSSSSNPSIPRSPFLCTSNNAVIITLVRHSSSTSISLSSFAIKLTAHLSVYGSAVYLSPSFVDRQLGENTCAHLNDYFHRSRFTCWLTEVEEQHRFIVLETNDELMSWTRCCVRTADCVFVVADAKADPKVGTVEEALLWSEEKGEIAAASSSSSTASSVPSSSSSSSSSSSRSSSSSSSRPPRSSSSSSSRKRTLTFCIKDLVLLHSPSTLLPSGTRYWFMGRPLHTYHHVRMDLASHYDRLARYLAGTCIGLVLSGGGARGLAHLGTVRARIPTTILLHLLLHTPQ